MSQALHHEAPRTRNQGPLDCQSQTYTTNACQPPGPGPSSGPYYTSSVVGSTAGSCGDQEAGRPGQGTKPGLGLGFVPWPE